jgi:putative ABC transport system substrate-binding protein
MTGKAFAVLLALASVSMHVVVEAQQTGKAARVGFLTPLAASDPRQASLLDALRDELRTLGYMEGRNLLLERRYAEGRLERLP